MTNRIREQITGWLTASDTCFLLGAGCSVCAGKPMIEDLTKKVLSNADAKLIKHFNALKHTDSRAATVEDLINYLVRYREILNTITNSGDHDISIKEIDDWISDIKTKIVSEVADNWKPSCHHRRFLQRIQNQPKRGPRDLFTLNYDTVLEATLDSLRIPYVDGFRGTNRAWFDPKTFDDLTTDTAYRLFKLHGSINWSRDETGQVRRGYNINQTVPNEPVIVYPSEQKYVQTRYGVYETLIGKFRSRLRVSSVNNCLVVLGYSFNDIHMNEAIVDGITSQDSNLTVISFVGPEEDRGQQKTRLENLADRCDLRFNAFIGSGETGNFIGSAFDTDTVKLVLDEELWKFENLVKFFVGEES